MQNDMQYNMQNIQYNMHNMQNMLVEFNMQNMQYNMQENMQNMSAICRFCPYCSILTPICKICKIICTICKICKHDFYMSQYALPTLLMAPSPAPLSGSEAAGPQGLGPGLSSSLALAGRPSWVSQPGRVRDGGRADGIFTTN